MTDDNNRHKDNNQQDSSKRLFSSGSPKLNNYLKEKSTTKEQHSYVPVESPNVENLYSNPLLGEIQKRIINEIDADFVQNLKDEASLISHIEFLLETLSGKDFPTLTKKEKTMVIQSLMEEFTGLGPLEKLIKDDSITEIMVNGPNQIYVEKNGHLLSTEIKFRDSDHVMQIIDKIIAPLGRRIDESSPMVDARLPGGSRVNAIIPPLSVKGPVLTIRKFSSIPLTMEKLVSFNTLSENMARFLELSVQAKANIIVAGGTGSGKTTFLNILSTFIPNGERIITIEDAAELQLFQPHVISLESRPANIESKGEITIRDLLRNSLRMRPDRIIVGEVRGAEALDMLQAMNTGHKGSLSTIHANSARDALSRLETMVMYSGFEFPLKAIRDQICSALDLIVYTERLADGTRKVTQITEVLGTEESTILLQDIFKFELRGKSNGKIRGEFFSTSIRPKLFEKFDAQGFQYQGIL